MSSSSYELLTSNFDLPIKNYCDRVIASSTECDFTVYEDPQNDDIISSVHLSGEKGKDGLFYGLKVQQFRHNGRGEWLEKTRDIDQIQIADQNYSIDRFINMRSCRSYVDAGAADEYFTTSVISGRSVNTTNANLYIFFLASITTKAKNGKIDQSTSTINFLTNIFDYSFADDYIDYKTSLFEIPTTPSTPSNTIHLIYIYRTSKTIPFRISYILIGEENSSPKKSGNFDGYSALPSGIETLSAWSEKNIYESIVLDNTKPIFYVYYDLVSNTLHYVYFKVNVSADRTSFSIDTDNIINKQVIFNPSTNLGGMPIGTIGISGNGKVVTLNDHVFCLFENPSDPTDVNLYAADLTPSGLGFLNPSMKNNSSPRYPTGYSFYQDTSPIISTTGKQIIAIDYSAVKRPGDGCGSAPLFSNPVVKGYTYVKTTDTEKTIGTYKFTGKVISIGDITFNCSGRSCDVYSNGINRSNLLFRDAVFDPSKSAVDNKLTVKLWMYFYGLGITNKIRFGILNFTKTDLGLNEEDTNFLDGPFISDPKTIKTIISPSS